MSTQPHNKPASKTRSLLLRIGGSIAIMALLIWFVQGQDVLGKLRLMQPAYVLAAVVAFAAVVGSNSLRWRVLLRGYEIECTLWETFKLYWVSLFFTLFLPGSAGGDVVRSYYIAQGPKRLAVVLLATFQERLAGLGSLLVVGLCALALLWGQIGVELRITLALMHIAGLGIVAAALYPAFWIALVQRIWQWVAHWGGVRRLAERGWTQRIHAFLLPMTQPLRLSSAQICTLAIAMSGSAMFGIGTYWLLALALHLDINFFALCIASSVVTLARVLPISFNGIGVGEGTFMIVLQPFGVSHADAFALSLAGLAVHTIAGLIGGIFYMLQINRGMQPFSQKSMP